MELTIFKSITTKEALEKFKANGEKYDGLFVDMNNADERRFVKNESSEIKSLIKKVDRHRIDEKKRFGLLVDKEAADIIDTLKAANAPYTLLEDAYKAERAKILAEEKAIKEAEELALQIPIDHEEALQLNKLFEFEKQEAIRAQEERDKQLLAEQEQKRTDDLAAAEQRRLNDIKAVKQQAIDDAKVKAEEERQLKLARIANQEHVTAVCKQAKEQLMQYANLTEEQAVSAVKAIRNNSITSITINF